MEEIIAAAELKDAEIVAIASHGRGGLSRAFYGSPAAANRQALVAYPIHEELSQAVNNLARKIRFSILNNPAS